jgi:hypothetical protein
MYVASVGRCKTTGGTLDSYTGLIRHVGGKKHTEKNAEEGHEAVDTSEAKGVGTKRRLATTQYKQSEGKKVRRAQVAQVAHAMASPPPTLPAGTPPTAVPPVAAGAPGVMPMDMGAAIAGAAL